VLFLLTDAEEAGLLGARSFTIEETPLMKTVSVVLNLESRGNSGAANLFETGPGSSWMVRLYGRAVPAPYGSSLGSAIYDLMPNNTDFSVFRAKGKSGLNFANIGGLPAYHTALDTPARADLRTIQHHGVNTQALLR